MGEAEGSVKGIPQPLVLLTLLLSTLSHLFFLSFCTTWYTLSPVFSRSKERLLDIADSDRFVYLIGRNGGQQLDFFFIKKLSLSPPIKLQLQ